jgi:hypothetical protein
VACVGPTESVIVDVCDGYVVTGTDTPASDIRRYREQRRVRLVDPRTGEIVAEQSLEGPAPGPCPDTAPSSLTSKGRPLTADAVLRGIARLVAARPVRSG